MTKGLISSNIQSHEGFPEQCRNDNLNEPIVRIAKGIREVSISYPPELSVVLCFDRHRPNNCHRFHRRSFEDSLLWFSTESYWLVWMHSNHRTQSRLTRSVTTRTSTLRTYFVRIEITEDYILLMKVMQTLTDICTDRTYRWFRQGSIGLNDRLQWTTWMIVWEQS